MVILAKIAIRKRERQGKGSDDGVENDCAVVDGGVRRDGEVAVVGMLFRERAGNGCATVAVEVHLGL